MFFLSRNKSTYHYFRPLEVVPICQTMGIFYVKVWLYFLDKLLKVRSGYVRFCLQRHHRRVLEQRARMLWGGLFNELFMSFLGNHYFGFLQKVLGTD